MKKTLALILTCALFLLAIAGCAQRNAEQPSQSAAPGGSQPPAQSEAPAGGGSVYFLNFKPEIADQYNALVAAYAAETGVHVKVQTAASGMYEQTLMSEIAKTDAPTIFQINGPVGYDNWADYCADLSDSALYGMLADQSLAFTRDGGVYGIPYVVEGYGIIYNDAILKKYFALEGAVANSMDEINSFAKLKALVEDMQDKREQLGIEGVFAATSLSAGNQWRWQTHLANLPFYYEFRDAAAGGDTVTAGLAANEVAFTYAAQFKNIFDLYTDNSTTKKGMLGAKSVDDSMAEFALGRCAMVQNGNWSASQILGVDGNVVADTDIKFLPIYTGMAGEEAQGLCIGTENYFAINAKASAQDQQASLDFLAWMFSSDTGKEFALNHLGIVPFNTFGDDELPADPLGREVMAWMNKDGVVSVPWTSTAFPSEAFKNYFGDALLEYVQGTMTWDEVVSTVKNSWAAERAANPIA